MIQKYEHWMVLVLILKKIAKSKNITHAQIADKIGLHTSNITRIFSLKYCPSLKIFIAIAKAVEVNFFFEDMESTTDLNIIFEAAMAELGRRVEKLPKN